MLGAWPLASAASRGGKSREAAGRGNAVIESSPALPPGRCFLLPRLPFQWDPTFTKDAGRKTALMRSLGEEEEGSGSSSCPVWLCRSQAPTEASFFRGRAVPV